MLNDLEFAAVVVGVGAAARLGWGLIRKIASSPKEEPFELTDEDFVPEHNYTRDPDQPEIGTFLQELEAFETKAVKADTKLFKDVRASGEPIKGKFVKGNLDSIGGNVAKEPINLWGTVNPRKVPNFTGVFWDAASRPYNGTLGNEGSGDVLPSLVNPYVPVAKEIKVDKDPFEGFVELKNDNPDFEKVYDDRKGRRIFVINVANLSAGEGEKLLERMKERLAAAKAEKDAFVPSESKHEAWLDQYDRQAAVPEGEPGKFRQIDPDSPSILGMGVFRILPPSTKDGRPFRTMKTHCNAAAAPGSPHLTPLPAHWAGTAEATCTNTAEHNHQCPLCETNKKLSQHKKGMAFGEREVTFYPIYFPETNEYALLKANSLLHRKLVDLGATSEKEISHPYYGSNIRITKQAFGYSVEKLPSNPISRTPEASASIVKKGCDLSKGFAYNEDMKLSQAKLLDDWKKSNTELAALIELQPDAVGKKYEEMLEKLKNDWAGFVFLDIEGSKKGNTPLTMGDLLKKPNEEPKKEKPKKEEKCHLGEWVEVTNKAKPKKEEKCHLGEWVEVTNKAKHYDGLTNVHLLGTSKGNSNVQVINGDSAKIVGFGSKNTQGTTTKSVST